MSLATLPWRLITLKTPAKDMPYSITLLVTFLILDSVAMSAGLTLSRFPNHLAFKMGIISTLAAGAVLYGMLKLKKRQARFVQLWSAILAVDLLCTVSSLLLFQIVGANSLQSLLAFLISTWSWWVSVQFLTQGFEIKILPATGLSLLMQVGSALALLVFLPELGGFLLQQQN